MLFCNCIYYMAGRSSSRCGSVPAFPVPQAVVRVVYHGWYIQPHKEKAVGGMKVGSMLLPGRWWGGVCRTPLWQDVMSGEGTRGK